MTKLPTKLFDPPPAIAPDIESLDAHVRSADGVATPATVPRGPRSDGRRERSLGRSRQGV